MPWLQIASNEVSDGPAPGVYQKVADTTVRIQEQEIEQMQPSFVPKSLLEAALIDQ